MLTFIFGQGMCGPHRPTEVRGRVAFLSAVAFEHGGRELAADPAWGAVDRRLFDAEGDGWVPSRLLATVAARCELASADSVAEVIAWRIDAFLDGNPDSPQPVDISPGPTLPTDGRVPGPACPAYEGTVEARERLTALAAATLGGQLADWAKASA